MNKIGWSADTQKTVAVRNEKCDMKMTLNHVNTYQYKVR